MKTTIVTIFALCFALCSLGQPEPDEICLPDGVSTNPVNPVNHSAMPIPGNDPNALYFENHFEWFGHDGVSLDLFPMYDMDGYPEGETMYHPYSNQNQSYSYLLYNYEADPQYPLPFEELDMYWEDGWELLSVNLGFYPNLTPLADAIPAANSANDRIPYLVLYNKQRGIIRLFANYYTPPGVFYDDARIILRFSGADDDEQITSGLLRYNDGIDVALEEFTNVNEVTTTVKFPNNPEHWMHADFLVGYDPCTCQFGSSLKFQIDLVDIATLEMSSRTITANINLLDANGNINIDADFLPGVHFDPENDNRGIAIYKSITKMVETYRLQLRVAQIKNAAVNANNAKIKKQIAILNFIELLVKNGLTFITPAAAAIAAATVAAEEVGQMGIIAMNDAQLSTILSQLTPEEQEQYFYNTNLDMFLSIETTAPEVIESVDPNGTKHFDWKKLHDAVTKNLAGGFDQLTKHLEKGLQQNVPSPPMPTGSMSETFYSGEITNISQIEGWTMFNPGTYPSGQGNVPVDPSSYPIYNEVLGLFALLENPKIKYSHQVNDHEIIDITTTPGMGDNLIYHCKRKSRIEVRTKLNEQLKYALNPAAGIDMSQVEIQAAFVTNLHTAFSPSSQNNFNLIINPVFPEANNYFYVTLENIGDYSDLKPIVQKPMSEVSIMQTEFMSLAEFNSWVEVLNFDFIQNWTVNASAFDAALVNTVMQSADLGVTGTVAGMTFQLKLFIKMPFTPICTDCSEHITEQVFTYNILPENVSTTNLPLSILWSITVNPNDNGILSITPNLQFGQKNWNALDHALYGGYFLGPDETNPVVRAYAEEEIFINGNQTKNSELYGVELRAQNQISVTGDVTISDGFALVIDDFVPEQSIPTPQVTETYLASYCNGQAPNSYHANSTRNSVASSNNFANVNYQKKIQEKVQFSIYPNPTTETLNLSLLNFSGQVQFEIYNAIGNRLQSFSKTVDNGIRMNYITYSAADLPNGTYTIVARMADGTSVTEQFVVLK
jgi:hypothetical protein